jgi:hypothetical protein
LGLKKEEVKGDSTNLHNEGFHEFYNSLNIIRVRRLNGHVAHGGEGGRRKMCDVLVGKET